MDNRLQMSTMQRVCCRQEEKRKKKEEEEETIPQKQIRFMSCGGCTVRAVFLHRLSQFFLLVFLFICFIE